MKELGDTIKEHKKIENILEINNNKSKQIENILVGKWNLFKLSDLLEKYCEEDENKEESFLLSKKSKKFLNYKISVVTNMHMSVDFVFYKNNKQIFQYSFLSNSDTNYCFNSMKLDFNNLIDVQDMIKTIAIELKKLIRRDKIKKLKQQEEIKNKLDYFKAIEEIELEL